MRPPPPSPSPPPPASGSQTSGHHPPPSPSPPPPEATELVAFDDLGGGFESLKPTDLAEDGDDADVQHAIILTIALAVAIAVFLAWRACKRCGSRKESLPQIDGLEELRPRRTVADRVYGAKASAKRVQSGLRAKWASSPKHERVTELEEAREDSRRDESGSSGEDDGSSDEASSEGGSSSGSSASGSSASGPSAVPASEASAVPASEASASSAPSSVREGAAYAGAAYAESVATSYHGTEIGPDDSVSNIGRPCVLKAAKAAKARSLNQNVIVSLRDTRTGRTATLPATPADLDSLDALHAVFERAGLVRVGTCNFADAEQQLFELHSKADLRRARIHAVIIYATGEMVSAAPNPLLGARVSGGALDEGRAGSESAFSSSRPGRGGGLVFKSKKGAAAKPSGSESDDGETLVLFETTKKETGAAVDYF